MPRGRTSRRRRRRSPALPSLAALFQWLAARGFRNATRLAPRCFPDTGRGLLCRRSVPPGAALLRLPRQLLISGEEALRTLASCDCCRRHGLHVTTTGGVERLLSLFLTHERLLGAASAWAPYMASLPESFDCLACWMPEEVAAAPQDLRNSHVAAVAAFEAALAADGAALGAMAKAHGTFETRQVLLWARSAVNSRCVFCALPGVPKELSGAVLAPFLDLLNHAPSAKVEARFEDGHFELRALEGVAANTQAFICYGPHDSAALLTEYGFLAPGNPHDVVPVALADLRCCFGLSEEKVREKAKDLQLKFDPQGFCRALCVLPHGLTYCGLLLLHSLLHGDCGVQEEDELLRRLQEPLAVLLAHLQSDVRCLLRSIGATPGSYRAHCLRLLLQQRDVILTGCRELLSRTS